MFIRKHFGFSLLLVIVLLTACANPISLLSKAQPSPAPTESAPAVANPTIESAPTSVPQVTEASAATVPVEITSTLSSTSTLTSTDTTPALSITGKVQSPVSWSLDEIKSMPIVNANAKNAKGKVEAFSGVAIVDLLKNVVILPEAKDIGFLNSSGKRVSYSLAYIQSCPTCLLAYKNKGGFVLVVTGVAQPMAINGVKEIQIY